MNSLTKGLIYTLGRGISYTALAILMYLGLSSFQISRIFQGWGDKVLGPILILIGLIMLDVIKLNWKTQSEQVEKLKIWLAAKGYLGALLLGMFFALAFCPYSGVLFFGVLTPLILNSTEGILLAPVFALGTGLPVIVFSLIIAFSMQKMSKAFSIVSGVEKITRLIVSFIFISVGIYYLRFTFIYIISLL
jgi:cytochrome c-type biogenesis protein